MPQLEGCDAHPLGILLPTALLPLSHWVAAGRKGAELVAAHRAQSESLSRMSELLMSSKEGREAAWVTKGRLTALVGKDECEEPRSPAQACFLRSLQGTRAGVLVGSGFRPLLPLPVP